MTEEQDEATTDEQEVERRVQAHLADTLQQPNVGKRSTGSYYTSDSERSVREKGKERTYEDEIGSD